MFSLVRLIQVSELIIELRVNKVIFVVHHRREDWDRYVAESRLSRENFLEEEAMENGVKCVSCEEVIPVRPCRNRHEVVYDHLVNWCKTYRGHLKRVNDCKYIFPYSPAYCTM